MQHFCNNKTILSLTNIKQNYHDDPEEGLEALK